MHTELAPSAPIDLSRYGKTELLLMKAWGPAELAKLRITQDMIQQRLDQIRSEKENSHKKAGRGTFQHSNSQLRYREA